MSNAIRKVARESIKETCRKENGNNKNFKNEWSKYHDNLEEINKDGEIVRKSKKSGISRRKRKATNVKGFLKNIKLFKRNTKESK